MNIIVTGSAGFVGSHLVERLKLIGHHVLGVDKKTGDDLTDLKTLDYMSDKMPSVDFIFNLAGTCSTPRGFTEPLEAFENNTRATFHLMLFAKAKGAKVIHTSTVKAQESDDGMYTPYGLTKLMGEMSVKEFEDSFGVQTLINRPGTIYGPGQHGSDESGWLGWFIAAGVTGRKVTINGDGSVVRDVLYVLDYVRLLIDQMNRFDEYHDKGWPHFAVGGGNPNAVTILQAANLIKELTGLDFEFGPTRKGDNARLVADGSLLDFWEPLTDWQDGIKQTVTWYQKHKELL